jgi:hypothetical protein
MRRWIASAVALLAGALCSCPGLRMLWFGHGNEPRDECALWVCMNILSLMRQQRISREFRPIQHIAPPFDLQVQPSCKPSLLFAEETTETAFARVAQNCGRRVAGSQPPLLVTFA